MKVVVIDSYPLVRRGLIAVLSTESDIVLAGEGETEEEAYNLLETAKPDICIMNNKLNDRCGLQLIKEFKERGITTKFIYLTSMMTSDQLSAAELIMVDGYVMKEALPEELLYAIRLLQRGRRYYDPSLMEIKVRKDIYPFEELTFKEKEVLGLLGLGLNNKEIAVRLFVSEYTVKKHVSQVLAKLRLPDRTQAALYANSKGIVRYGRIS
ncbi:nitrate/nitrite response regulator protein narL [Paenibacillus swuensis]|uniref:Nitrate/nitrite response regulator protein narL n=1 Tax=Paenibacillus swuensis TaxID=1178515 RepID=A0A172TPZ1_9BACL|nr:response regulator transcription factor [Paenibacillus swuensis]ANE48877.1 nitrate/nitrite response regulator protein narL [Paenibacillus swuensis]